MNPEAFAGLVELLKIGGVGGLSIGGVIYLVALRRQAPEKTPLDHVKDDLLHEIGGVKTETTEVRADLAEFRLEVHGRLTVLETQMKERTK